MLISYHLESVDDESIVQFERMNHASLYTSLTVAILIFRNVIARISGSTSPFRQRADIAFEGSQKEDAIIWPKIGSKDSFYSKIGRGSDRRFVTISGSVSSRGLLAPILVSESFPCDSEHHTKQRGCVAVSRDSQQPDGAFCNSHVKLPLYFFLFPLSLLLTHNLFTPLFLRWTPLARASPRASSRATVSASAIPSAPCLLHSPHPPHLPMLVRSNPLKARRSQSRSTFPRRTERVWR
jgi:hypothetical protein